MKKRNKKISQNMKKENTTYRKEKIKQKQE